MAQKISRREFTKRVATGAALLGLQPSCTSLSPSLPTGQLLRNDLTDLSGHSASMMLPVRQPRTTLDTSCINCRPLCSSPARLKIS